MLPRHTLILLALAGAAAARAAPDAAPDAGALEDTAFWTRSGQAQIAHTLAQLRSTAHARNVILFIGDGMGINTVTAARIFQGQRHGRSGEENTLSFERFPVVGLAKTYALDKQVPDSAATATAMLTGVKVRYGTIGLNASAGVKACDAERDPARRLPGMMTWAQAAGKWTGVVTTTRVTHATPAAAYAHTNHRDWECDNSVPAEQRTCIKDIARQLVEDLPGRDLNVILGGGARQLGVADADKADQSCGRTDGRSLAADWLAAGPRRAFVDSASALMAANLSAVDRLLGLFSPGHLPYVSERSDGHPSLVDMTLRAMALLRRGPRGYFLLVEAGRIDHAHHDNMPRLALEEACELDEAVAAAAAAASRDDTLLLVTADHSHAMTLNGYPARGHDVLGLADEPDTPPHETLSYANGPGFVEGGWVAANEEDRRRPRHMHLAAMPRSQETHAGEDVAVFADGPLAHLFGGVYEQGYIAHAMAYAACLGPPGEACRDEPRAGVALSGAGIASGAGFVGIGALAAAMRWIAAMAT